MAQRIIFALAISGSIGLFVTNNITDAIYCGVVATWVRPEK